MAWQAGLTAVFGLAGAFSHGPGLLGLAITLLSWMGLLGVQRRAARAGRVAAAALREGLGPDWSEQVHPRWRPVLEERLDWRRVVFPFPIRRREVEKLRDLPFARAGGLTLRLDLYRPRVRDADVRMPVLLQIHGGAWMIGDKREQALPLLYQLASHGWLCASANYRLSPHATFPDHLVDCKRALTWIREHAAEHGGDPDFVVVTGGSAGGHLAALLALTAGDPALQPGFEQADTHVRACVPFYGVYDFLDRAGVMAHDALARTLERRIMKGSPSEIPEAYEQASPVAHVRPDAPPFFVVHGDADTLVPVAEARHFVRALREKSSQPVVYAEIPGAQHAFEIFPSLRTLRVGRAVERFLAWVHSRYLEEKPEPSPPRTEERPPA